MRRACGFVSFLVTAILSGSARAQIPSSPEVVVGNLDAHAGGGIGAIGIAAHIGASGLAWLGDVFAVGAQAGYIEDDAILGSSSSAWYIGPAIGVRTSSSGTYGYLMGGAGIAGREVRYREFCIFDPCGASSTSPPNAMANGADYSLSAGVAFHIKSFEVGPMLRAESLVGHPIWTFNVALGAALTSE